MKNILLALAALSLSTAAVAADNARFTGFRADVNVGTNDFSHTPDRNSVTYSATAGLDIPVGSKLTIGAELDAANVFQRERQYGAAARLGYAINPNFLAYGKVGYANYKQLNSRKLDGFVAGGGLQFAISDNTYLKGEYTHTFFDNKVASNAGTLGVGFRF